jgi:hypothetical protein
MWRGGNLHYQYISMIIIYFILYFIVLFYSLLWNRAQINNKTRKITVQLLIIDGFGFKLQGHTCPHLINLYVTSCKIVL